MKWWPTSLTRHKRQLWNVRVSAWNTYDVVAVILGTRSLGRYNAMSGTIHITLLYYNSYSIIILQFIFYYYKLEVLNCRFDIDEEYDEVNDLPLFRTELVLNIPRIVSIHPLSRNDIAVITMTTKCNRNLCLLRFSLHSLVVLQKWYLVFSFSYVNPI